MTDQEQCSSHQGSSNSPIKTSNHSKESDQESSASQDSINQVKEDQVNDPDEEDRIEDQENLLSEEKIIKSNSEESDEKDRNLINLLAKRPEIDCKVASRFINHAIQSDSNLQSNQIKRKLEQTEIEERLENGKLSSKAPLPEIRQVIKSGGWNDDDDDEDSDSDEDLKVFD
ncbi:hypothetical protein DFH28DRAFT_1117318 [Melampsora americana]|nr:hypothetical protein DFH28DRAFT_1117318 [Melampsora americana]